MKKLFVLFVSALLVLGVASVRAEDSAGLYDESFRSQQVMIEIYNGSGRDISSNYVVIIDNTATAADVSAGGRLVSNLGVYATMTTATGSAGIIGVADEDIATGAQGRVCVRGPHQVKVAKLSDGGATYPLPGQWVTTGLPSEGEAGQAVRATPSDATAAAGYGTDMVLGYRLGVAASNPATNSTNDLIWIWVSPTSSGMVL